MNRKIFLILIFAFMFFVPNVNASNIVDYKLVIGDDYQFNETITYSLTDYEDIENGFNYYSTIVNEDIYTDIMYKQKYKKTKKLVDGKYYVTLSHTFSEYTMSNSKFLNDCFENADYNYDMDHYSFKGSGGFQCMFSDKLTITIVTDFDVTSTNAIVSGNKYIWNVTDDKFTMNISMNKEFDTSDEAIAKESDTDYVSDEDVYENYIPEDKKDNSGDSDSNVNDESSQNQQDDEKSFPFVGFGIFLGIILIIGFIVFIVLTNKRKNLNQI